MRSRCLLIFVFIGLAFSAFSQTPDTTKRRPVRAKTVVPQQPVSQRTGSSIVDDTTKSIYGPLTTRWTTEREMFTGKTNFRPLDTTINNYHRWTYVQRSGNLYHDLGNNGTALNPIFPLVSSNIGATAGFNGFAPYWNEELKLYDTKSPYTRMYLVWGGEGRAATRVEYSRNINPKWNISFNYRPILTDKQILRNGRADRNVISNYYDIYTHYTTKDDRYKVLAAYQRIRHRVIENGGISFNSINPADSSYDDYFGTVSPQLTRASSYEQHNKFHVFQQINVFKVQAYHVMDLETQVNWYRDDLTIDSRAYYDWGNRIDSVTKVQDSSRFKTSQHQLGVKGQIGKNNNLFYNGWVKFRKYSLYNKFLGTDTLSMPGKGLEKYIGGEIQYALDSVQHITALIEALDGGYGRIEASGHMKWFDFMATQRISKPTFLQTAYGGHFDLWSNNFKAVETTYLSAFPKVTVGPLFISPGVTFTSFNNYIYFAKGRVADTVQTVLPLQAQNLVTYATPQVYMDVRFLKKLHLRPQVLYTKILADKDSVLRIPELFVNAQLAFEGDLFKKAIQVQFGVDLHWHSSYKPMGYDPVIQTFYNQETVQPPAYFLGDIFLNGKIKRGRFFLKYHNFMQRFTKDNVGYMPTPFYRGVPSIMDFGFELMLFD
ncbi:MAG TPA: putative porin [Cyclobacteriaceae bacterium]|nr:putative porin [Cyclobacteriaceae bacterium]